MLKSKPKSWATLIVRGKDMNPDHLTKILEITPDFVILPHTKNLQDKDSTPHWQLNSTLSPESDMEEHIFEILKKISHKRKEFREFSHGFECTIYISVEFADMETNGIRLQPRTLLLLGDLGVSLELIPWLNQS